MAGAVAQGAEAALDMYKIGELRRQTVLLLIEDEEEQEARLKKLGEKQEMVY